MTYPSQRILYIGVTANFFPPGMPAPTPDFPWLQFLHAVTLKTELHTSTCPYRLQLEKLRHLVVDNYTWSRPVDKLKSFTGGEGLMQCSKLKLPVSYLSAKEQLLILPLFHLAPCFADRVTYLAILEGTCHLHSPSFTYGYGQACTCYGSISVM